MTVNVSTLLDNMQAHAGFAETSVSYFQNVAMDAVQDMVGTSFGNLSGWGPSSNGSSQQVTVRPLDFVPMNINPIEAGTVPTITATYAHNAVKPDAPELSDISTPSDLNLPTQPTVSISDLFKMVQPELNNAEFSTPMPVIDYATIDDLLAAIEIPTLANYVPPTLSAFNAPDLPNVTVPTFSPSTGNVEDPGLLGDQSAVYQTEYDTKLLTAQNLVDVGMQRWLSQYAPDYSAAMAQLEDKLADGINRGTALEESYENNLYAQARGKGEREFARAINEIENGAKKRGFVLPTGAMMSGIAAANQATASSNALAATTVAIERAKMEVQHIQFVMSTSAQVRQSLQNAFLQYASQLGQINAQAIESAKAIVDTVLKVHGANLERFKAQLDVLKTEAAIYETQLKASLAQLDIYKLEIEGAKLQLESDQLQIENYSKLIAAEQIKVELAVALLKSVETRAGIEKMKVEAFAEEAKAYTAKLGSDELRVKVYTALLSGDEAKLKAELSKLDVYEKLVDASVKKYGAEAEKAKLDVQRNQLLLQTYQAELEAFKTESSVEASVFEAGIKGDLAKIDAYKQTLLAKIETLKGNIAAQTLTLEAKKATANVELEAAKLQNARDLGFTKMVVDLNSQVAGTYGDIAKAALSGINGMASEITQAS